MMEQGSLVARLGKSWMHTLLRMRADETAVAANLTKYSKESNLSSL